MKNKWQKNLLNTCLLLGLTGFAFWFALKDEMGTVLTNIKQIPLAWIFLILCLGVLYYFIQGVNLYWIGKSFNPLIKLRHGLQNAFIAAFFNGVTPLGGSQVAQTYIFRKNKIAYPDIAGILWMDFFVYQSVVIFYALLFIITKGYWAFDKFDFLFFLVIVGFLINSFVILTLWTMSIRPQLYQKLSSLLVKLSHKIRLIKNPEATIMRWNEKIMEFNTQIQHMSKNKMLVLKTVSLYLLRQMLYYSMPFFVAKAMGLSIPLQDLYTVMAMACFIHMLNALTPLPGDTGWTESAFILIFSVLFGKVEASSVMLLWRAATYYINILIGGLVFLLFKFKMKKSGADDLSMASMKEECEQLTIHQETTKPLDETDTNLYKMESTHSD